MKTVVLVFSSFLLLDIAAWIMGWSEISISLFDLDSGTDFLMYAARWAIVLCIYFLLNKIHSLLAGRHELVSDASS